MRVPRTIIVWDNCECGEVLYTLIEAERGSCAKCWFKAMPADTKEAMNQILVASLGPKKSEAERLKLIADAEEKLKRDQLDLEQKRNSEIKRSTH